MGPDVLWLDASLAVPLEAKNRLKEATDAISKHTAGQLMQAEAWTRQTYPEKEVVPVSVHPAERCGWQTVMPEAARVDRGAPSGGPRRPEVDGNRFVGPLQRSPRPPQQHYWRRMG
jgi:hypothetical protein